MVEKLKCPHNKNVTMSHKMGLNVFYHDNGSLCEFFNKGAISIDRMNKAFVKYHKPNPDSVSVMASLSSKYVLNYVIDKIEHELCLRDVMELLLKYGQCGVLQPIESALISYFGRYIIELICASDADRYADCSKYDIQHHSPKKRPKCMTEFRLTFSG